MSFPISITWTGGQPPVAGFQQMAAAAAKLDSSLTTSAGNFDKFASSVGKIEGPIGGVAQGVEGLNTSIGGIGGAIGPAASGMESFAGSTETLNGAIAETGGFVTDATGSMTEFGGAATEAGTGATELGTAATEANTGVTDLGTSAQTTVPTFADMATGATDSGTAVTELGTAATEGGTHLTEMGTAATDTAVAEADLTTATTDTNTALGDSVDALGNVVPGLQDAATGASDSAQGFSELAPPVEDTNAALDSSSGLLEGVAPLLGAAGENAGTAAGTTDEFSGALGGLNTELPGVNGGLTTGNTLVGDFGTEAGTTQGKTDDLKGSMASLAFGLTTLVSSGLGLVGAFTSIRDAGFKVEAANLRAEKATTILDKAMLSAGKAIQKLATDSEAPIGGMQRLQTAFANFQKLIDAGITRGPQYTAALNELKAAGDALEGSTNKDNNAIKALNISLDGLGQKASKADLENRKLTKSLEAQAESYVQAGLTLASFAGGIGSTIQTITTMGSALGIMKGVLIDVGLVLSQTIIPALGAIAIPVGIAVAAIVGFIAAVTAIRANIKVFDDMGVAIGKVFPAMIPMLQGARQAFINFSDAINSSVSVILGGVDALTGGTLKLKEHWDGFTDTLPKGTANVNTLDQSLFALAKITGAAGETAKLTAGQFKIVGDSIVRLSDGAKIGRTHWQQLDATTVEYSVDAAKVPPVVEAQTAALTGATTAQDAFGATAQTTGAVLKEQTANFSELTAAQKYNASAQNAMIEGITKTHEEMAFATAVAVKYLEQIAGVNTELFTSNAIITGVSDALMNQTKEHFDAVRAAAAYIVGLKGVNAVAGLTDAQVLKLAEDLKKQNKETGKAAEETAKYTQELNTLNQTLQDNAAELSFYANATNMANRMQLEFNLGVQDAELKLNKRTFALARGAGELQRNIELLNEGKLLEIAYGEGVLAAGNAIVKKSEALATAAGQYNETNRLIEEENLLLVDMMTGYQEARTAVQAHTEALAKAIGALAAWNDEATRTQAIANAVVQGWVDAQTALQDMATEAANAVGAIASLRKQLEDSGAATVRFNQGLLDGRKSALEWAVGLDRARGQALGFRDEVVKVAGDVGVSMQDMSHLSTEAIQQIIEVAAGIPSAFEGILGELDSFGQRFVDILTKAGEEGKVNVEENIDQLEEDLNVKFQSPLREKIKLEADRELVTKDIDTLMGSLATSIANNPLKIEADTVPAQQAIQLLIQKIDDAGAAGSHLQPLRTALVGLSQVDMTNIHEFAPALARVVKEAQAAGEPFDGLMAKFQELGPLAQMSASELDTVAASFQTMGLTLNTTTGEITNATGILVGEWGKWGVGAQEGVGQAVTAMDTLGPAGTKARTTLAFELVALEFLMDRMAQEVKQSAIEVSTAFANMSVNTNTSMQKMASGILIMIAAFPKLASNAQSMASTVSGAFSNMATNMIASMNKMASGLQIMIAAFPRLSQEAQKTNTAVSSAMSSMTSKVSSFASSFASSMSKVSSSASSAQSAVSRLASAINSLKSKSITITVTTVYRTVYAAGGGAFVSSSPTKIGPMHVSEFGQKELVTVTPLEGPGRNKIKGLSDIMAGGKEKAEKKAGRLLEREATEPSSAQKEMVMMRETPIIIQVDGREIARVVNKRIFEESDALV